MTAQTRAVLKGEFEDGDTPAGSNYEDLIDSFVSISDTTAQSIASDLSAPILIATTEVSSPQGNFTEVSASVGSYTRLLAQNVSASAGNFNTLRVAGTEVLPAGAGAEAQIYITATAATSIGSAGTFELVNGTFSAVSLTQFSAQADGTVEYIGTDAKRIDVRAHISVVAAAVNKLSALRIGKNSTTISSSEIERFISSTNIGALSVGAVVSVNTNDTIGVFVANKTDATNMTIEKMTFIAIQT